MELWIRSQDKETLMKVNRLDIDLTNGTYKITTNDFKTILGEYKYKSRALEVLDEIHNMLMPISEYKQEIDNLIINYKNIDTVVYEMPKE